MINKLFSSFLPGIVLGITLFCPNAVAQEPCPSWHAKIVSIEGVVEISSRQQQHWIKVALNQTICPEAVIRVHSNSRALLELSNETVIRLDQNTSLVLSPQKTKDESWLDILKGAVHFISRVQNTLKIKTPYVNAGVEGTEFLIRVHKQQTLVVVVEGQVTVENEYGQLKLRGGESAITKKGSGPLRQLDIKPLDAVQWTLYYPAIIDRAERRTSVADGDSTSATDLVLHADALLAVGQVEQAQTNLDKALKLNSANSDAVALKSIIALATNNKNAALSLARQAVSLDVESARAKIALSYAHQAHFDLENAVNVITAALDSMPNNSLLWSRCAELKLSMGKRREALTAANKAIELNPKQAIGQMVIGFIYLSQIDMQKAKKAFELASRLDQAHPLSRLGLGLVFIREGDIKRGRRELEIAVGLDPNNALLRSYLGKAYYEEKRVGLADSQFELSKLLDPFDPTPWYYHAVSNQSQNQPVAALKNLQQSIALNDNRAVYRSGLLLDQDAAARSVNIARIANDLGFERLALTEGWKSVNSNPASFSAHRFLADAYAKLPRHHIPRASELLTAQLLQPINTHSLQPYLMESSLGILDGTGPTDPSFNEYNSLFTRNGVTVQTNTMGGGQNTWGDDLMVSAVHDNVSYSLGQFHYETDGFREGADQNVDIYSAFVQSKVGSNTSFQFAYRDVSKENGDNTLTFLQDRVLKDRRENETIKSVRLGLHQKFSSNSQLIASLISSHKNFDFQSNLKTTSFMLENEKNINSIEIEHLWMSEQLRVNSGIGYSSGEVKEVTEIKLLSSSMVISKGERANDLRHTNAYYYAQYQTTEDLTLLYGVSTDFAKGNIRDRNQLNPKLGVTWALNPRAMLRVAAFRTLSREFINNQTIEPTQVAGFGQYLDDGGVVDVKRFSLAMDTQPIATVYTGFELSRRLLNVPFKATIISGPPSGPPPSEPPPSAPPVTFIGEAGWSEQLLSYYFYWTLNTNLTLSFETQFERFKRDSSHSANIFNIETLSMPIAFNYHSKNGLSVKLTATHYDQKGEYLDPNAPPFVSSSVFGSDRFWLMDFSLDYRLPRRWGKLSLGIVNLFDKSFNYQDTDVVNPRIQPKRFVFARFSLVFQ